MASPLAICEAKKNLNILLLGRSGVGKSTFINSFANYVTYEKLEQISEEDIVHCLIPSTLVLYDDEGKEKIFKLGEEMNEDQNESMDPTKSGTRGCKEYRFNFGKFCVNFIDTPGIVDTKGIEQDKKNLAKILDFLSCYNSIHGVCILLKPNEERLDKVLRYWILELLSQLDKSAAKNILFVFTNARSTLYKLGRTGTAINELLEEIKKEKPDIDIKFTIKNYFCLDSEAFQFLVARDEMVFDEVEKAIFSQSWTKSRNECVRMINYVASLPEHYVQDTISINRARRLISILSKPLADILKNISENKGLCEEQDKEIRMHKGDIWKLKDKLYIPRKNLNFIYYDFPRIFCASENCIEVISVDGAEKTHYGQVCFELKREDTLKFAGYGAMFTSLAVVPEILILGVIGALGVGAYIWYKGTLCPKCECKIVDHMIRSYETRTVIENIKDEAVMETIRTTEDAVKVSQIFLDKIKLEIQELNEEGNYVQSATSKFAVFLKLRALTPYNDAFEDYLDYLIEEAKNKCGSGPERIKLIQRLEKYKELHQKEKEALENATRNGASVDLTPKDIDEVVRELCNLKIYGSKLKDAIEKHTKIQTNVRQDLAVIQYVSENKKGLTSGLEKGLALLPFWR